MTSSLPESCFVELSFLELVFIFTATFTAIMLLGLIASSVYKGIKRFLTYIGGDNGK